MKTCPHCGEEVQDVEVIFHRCSSSGSAMPRKENPEIDFLKWWLIILTAISGTIWGPFIWDLGLPKDYSAFWDIFFKYLSTPTLLSLSWILWWRDNWVLSVLLSIFQVFISLYIVIIFIAIAFNF